MLHVSYVSSALAHLGDEGLDRGVEESKRVTALPFAMLVREVIACEMSSNSSDGEVDVSTTRLHLIAEVHVLDEAYTCVSLFRSTWHGSSSTKLNAQHENEGLTEIHSLILSSREYSCNASSHRGFLGDTQAVVSWFAW